MKYFFYLLLTMLTMNSNAQTKDETVAQSKAELLEQTVFGTKDSVTLEKLFATKVHYEHSHGQVQTREQAIHGIVNNKSVYVISTVPSAAYKVETIGDSIFVNKPFKAIEKKVDGTDSPLDFTVTTVWFKEGGELKMSRRKATTINRAQ